VARGWVPLARRAAAGRERAHGAESRRPRRPSAALPPTRPGPLPTPPHDTHPRHQPQSPHPTPHPPKGPFFKDVEFLDFYNLELSDTNVTDHNTHKCARGALWGAGKTGRGLP
jgi:hypothetical protein